MPNPRYSNHQPVQGTFAQIRPVAYPEPLIDDKGMRHCNCAAQTILAQSRGQEVPLCADMPWVCPFRARTGAPVA